MGWEGQPDFGICQKTETLQLRGCPFCLAPCSARAACGAGQQDRHVSTMLLAQTLYIILRPDSPSLGGPAECLPQHPPSPFLQLASPALPVNPAAGLAGFLDFCPPVEMLWRAASFANLFLRLDSKYFGFAGHRALSTTQPCLEV